MKDMLAAADIVISRAGANAICELLALKKPNILIPLSAQASRGDQILNANSFEKQGFSKVMQDEEVTKETLLAAVDEVYKNREKYIEVMKQAKTGDAEEVIIGLIKEVQK
jgi:UDP-N-acetylglucosamine--N-acetylmuramyl-(pentapeptide) pyrophosphoryl-undecaprenol N-acetylglucosamine transferase